MKDIHNHLLYNIDDGSISLEDSIEILNDLYGKGVTDIVLTPHYIIGTNYNSNNKKKMELLKKLKQNTKVNLYLGNEIYLDNNIIDYIKKGEISTINNSKYLLVELPLSEKLDSAKDIIFELVSNGAVPIIAHPERYHYLSLKDLEDFINQGCLLQGNISSLIGKYGEDAKKNLELLLKKHMIHVLGTDTHRHKIDITSCLNSLKAIIDENMFNDLTINNFDNIVNDKDVEAYEIIDTKGFFKEKLK